MRQQQQHSHPRGGTCKVLKRSGEVVMHHNGGISDQEINAGYVLACCSRPTTPVEIEA